MKQTHITQQIAEFALTDFNQIYTEQDLKLLKIAFMDWLAVTLAGCKEGTADKLLELYKSQETTAGNCTVIGFPHKVSSLWASLINGTSSHALDFDDIHDYLSLHLCVPIFSAVFTAAEQLHSSGKDILIAASNGMQVMVALSTAIMPEHYAKGWHATATLGIFGAAAACGYLYHLTVEQMCHAFGIAASQMSGLQLNFGTMSKPMQPAKAARNALESVILAKNDFTGCTDIFDGVFLDNISTRVDRDAILPRLKGSLAIYELRYKRYPCGAPTHSGIINCRKIIDEHNIKPSDIERIVLEPYPRAIRLAGIPYPQTGLQGKFSMPFCAVASILKEKVLISTFTDEVVNEPEIQDMLTKIEMIPNDKFTASRGGKATIYTKDGASYSNSTYLLGKNVDYDKQVTDVTEKFFEITEPIMGTEKAQKIYDCISKLETLASITAITSLL